MSHIDWHAETPVFIVGSCSLYGVCLSSAASTSLNTAPSISLVTTAAAPVTTSIKLGQSYAACAKGQQPAVGAECELGATARDAQDGNLTPAVLVCAPASCTTATCLASKSACCAQASWLKQCSSTCRTSSEVLKTVPHVLLRFACIYCWLCVDTLHAARSFAYLLRQICSRWLRLFWSRSCLLERWPYALRLEHSSSCNRHQVQRHLRRLRSLCASLAEHRHQNAPCGLSLLLRYLCENFCCLQFECLVMSAICSCQIACMYTCLDVPVCPLVCLHIASPHSVLIPNTTAFLLGL